MARTKSASRKPMTHKRAKSDLEKWEVLLRLFTLWSQGDNKYLRLGQMLGNYIRSEAELYNIEDYDLIDKLESEYTKEHGN